MWRLGNFVRNLDDRLILDGLRTEKIEEASTKVHRAVFNALEISTKLSGAEHTTKCTRSYRRSILE